MPPSEKAINNEDKEKGRVKMAGTPHQGNQPDESIILNHAAKIGIQAKLDGLAKSQIEQIIASLENMEDPRLSLLVTASFAYRQANRLGRGHRTANLIGEAMQDLYTKNYGKEQARKLLGLAKWVYESVERQSVRPVNSYTEYLVQLVGRR
ncbi:MAG: hypothetical protein QXK69_09895 [Candidatus Caldarchaeum sp.]